MGRILIGTSSWADASLTENGFYPYEVKTSEEKLRFYSSAFPLTEIDSSYHFLPALRNLDSWVENTHSGFLFDIKAFSLFTQHPTPVSSLPADIRREIPAKLGSNSHLYLHHLPDQAVDSLWKRFTADLAFLSSAGKLGLVVFQFPPWYHPSPANLDYILNCQQRTGPYPAAVEFRTPDWLDDVHRENTLKFFKEHGLCLVCVDEPPGLKSSLPPLAEITASIGAVRFHGRNRENWEQKSLSAGEKFHYLYKLNELQEWAAKINGMASRTSAVHVIFKNKPTDLAAQNAGQLRSILG